MGRDGWCHAELRQPQSPLGCFPEFWYGAAAAPHILTSLLLILTSARQLLKPLFGEGFVEWVQLEICLLTAAWVAAHGTGSGGFSACQSRLGGEHSEPAQPVSLVEREKVFVPEGGCQLLCRSQALCPIVLGPRRGNPGFSPQPSPEEAVVGSTEGLVPPRPPAHRFSLHPTGQSQRLGSGRQC